MISGWIVAPLLTGGEESIHKTRHRLRLIQANENELMRTFINVTNIDQVFQNHLCSR